MEWLFGMSIENMMLDVQKDDPKTIDISVETEIKEIVEVFACLLVNASYLCSKENGHSVISSQDVVLGCGRVFKILRGGK